MTDELANAAGNRSVLIHQLTKHQTQAPFKKQKGDVQRVAFHPSRPQFFVAVRSSSVRYVKRATDELAQTQRYIRMYDLLAQQLVKTLNPGLKWISSLDVHPLGGSSSRPSSSNPTHLFSQTTSLSARTTSVSSGMTSTSPPRPTRHSATTRAPSAPSPSSPVYPLFLSTSDDGSIHIFHSTVYSDLLTNPLIVPLKVLKGHEIKDGLGVLDAKWHPRGPWVVSVGADGNGRLWM